MNPRMLIRLALLATLATITNDATANAQAEATSLVLFDGRSLDGWQPVAGARAGKVVVDGGMIALAAGEPMTGLACTRGELPKVNYILTYEAKRTAGNDFFAAATFPVGASFVTLVPGGWGGSVTGLSLIDGASAAENSTNHFVKYQNDVWYTFRVEVTARAIRCRVDDREVFTFDHRDAQLKTRLENRANQPLGFASYRSAGQIRRVEVKPLSAAEVAAVDARVDQD